MEIRLLSKKDLATRVEWMNDERVNNTLNIQLPVNIESTEAWFERIVENPKRCDLSFTDNGELVAMGGFTDIDNEVRKAELYIFVSPYQQGKGYGKKSLKLLCEYGFMTLKLNKIYLHTNADNIAARKLYDGFGFTLAGYATQEVINNGKIKDRLYYELFDNQRNTPPYNTLRIKQLDFSTTDFFLCEQYLLSGRNIMIVRDDIFPAVGGGSKARKAVEYEAELKRGGYNALVTTGGVQSNHNRAMALMAARNGWKCHLVCHGSQDRFDSEKGNAQIIRNTKATQEFVEASAIGRAMDEAMEKYKAEGLNPYYVIGGGHNMAGGLAYVKAVMQLHNYGKLHNYKPDVIYHASGTGSTQGGILVGLELVGWNDVKVVGISIARQQERGKQVVAEYANELGKYLGLNKDFDDRVIFNTDYLCGGYENYTPEMKERIDEAMLETGLVFDTTYSGKALYGMLDCLEKDSKQGNVLFWHTGGIMNFLK